MIQLNTFLKPADTSGGLWFKTLRIFGGFKRHYARLGEIIRTCSTARKRLRYTKNRIILEKRRRTAIKKLKTKRKKGRTFNVKKYESKTYLSLIVSTKSRKKRFDGMYIKFDENRMMAFKDPVPYGPYGKTDGVPVFLALRTKGPVCREILNNTKDHFRFRQVIRKSGGVV